jgi:NAD+ diphosphatase
VLGRQASWPEGLYATLAGFMEPGETIEQACARETMEEIHRPVLNARYVASQPWPFSSSLMIGLMAEIEPGELIPDDDLEDARWFTRDEVRALYEGDIGRKYPQHFSISRLLIDRWLDGEL